MRDAKRATRSRRLRKKLHLDEFRELGFAVRFALATSDDPLAELRFWHAFLAEAIETQALQYGGGREGFVCAERGSVAEAQREDVRAWLAARAEVTQVEVGPLVDAWYCSEDALFG